MGQPKKSHKCNDNSQRSLKHKQYLPWSPRTGGTGLSVTETREDEVAYDAAESAAYRCLAVEERQSPTELEARVEEREVSDGDRVKASYATRQRPVLPGGP
jgi:hypothetical protein